MSWEYQFLLFMQDLHTPILDKVMVTLTHLGDFGVMWTLFAILLLLMQKTKKIGRDMLLSIILSCLVCSLLLKNLIGRARPWEVYTALQPLVEKPFDSSFPSGHTANSFTAATALLFHERKAGALALLLACAMGFSRLYLLVHFPTDVLAGAAAGILCALAVCLFFRKRDNRLPAENRTG